MRVTVVLALPERQWVEVLDLPAGATVGDAVAASSLARRFPELEVAALRTGIWGKPCSPEAALRDDDRVELYRGIRADAKALRRARARATPSKPARSGR